MIGVDHPHSEIRQGVFGQTAAGALQQVVAHDHPRDLLGLAAVQVHLLGKLAEGIVACVFRHMQSVANF